MSPESEARAGGHGEDDEVAVPRLVCISTAHHAAIVLQHLVRTIVPSARVEAGDTAILRDPPDAHCVILAVGTMYSAAEVLIRALRSRGYRNALILVADAPEVLSDDALALMGAAEVLATKDLAVSLPGALERLMELEDAADKSPVARELLDSLRQLQALVAAGKTASGLRHRLNNPLAALLAEAQLMELEPLTPEHSRSVRRIVELCRRVIGVADEIDNVAANIAKGVVETEMRGSS